MFRRVSKILDAKTNDLRKLSEAAGVKTDLFYFDASFSGVDVCAQDLSGLNLERADFAGIIANSATRVDMPYRERLFRAALATRYHDKDISRYINSHNYEDTIELIVMLARAKDERGADILRNLLENPGWPAPKYSSNLICCEEIDPVLRSSYYNMWHKQYKNDVTSSIIRAIIYDENKNIREIARNSSSHIRKYSSIEYSDDHIDRLVMSVIADEDKRRMGAIEYWCEKNITNEKMLSVLEFCVIFDGAKTDRMAGIFVEWLDINIKRRNMSNLVSMAILYFQDPRVELAAFEWFKKHPRARQGQRLLSILMDSEVHYPALGSFILRWCRYNTIGGEKAFGAELKRYLRRFDAQFMTARTKNALSILSSSLLS